MNKQLEKIEEVLSSNDYNNIDFHTESLQKIPTEFLNKKACQMGIPEDVLICEFASEIFSDLLRLQEQLVKISDIVIYTKSKIRE